MFDRTLNTPLPLSQWWAKNLQQICFTDTCMVHVFFWKKLFQSFWANRNIIIKKKLKPSYLVEVIKTNRIIDIICCIYTRCFTIKTPEMGVPTMPRNKCLDDMVLCQVQINLVLCRGEYFDWAMLFASKYMNEKVKFFFTEVLNIFLNFILNKISLWCDNKDRHRVNENIKSLIKSRNFAFNNLMWLINYIIMLQWNYSRKNWSRFFRIKTLS